MNYVVSFIDNHYIDNIFKVWLPTLKKNFLGKIVLITFNVNKKQIDELKKQDVIVIEKELTLKGFHNLIAERLKAEEEFINTLENDDKIMLIDGADVVFQSEINTFFNQIQDKIYYSTTGTRTNQTTIKWFKRFFKKIRPEKELISLLKSETIKASGMLAGTKKSFVKYFKRHYDLINQYQAKFFLGINQVILTCLILQYPNEFKETDIQNCRLTEKDVVLKDKVFKIEKIIPIAHFSCPKMKQIYNNLYIENSINDKSEQGKLKILWLYGSINKWDDINHWYHLDFAKTLKNQPNVNLLVYGYKLHTLRPDLATIPYNENITAKDLKELFDFDVIILDNKNRFYKSPGNRDTLWLKPEFFDGIDNIPKIMLEGDYHLHFKHPDEESWYRDRKIDLLLVRHKTSLLYHNDNNISIQWFPCSVDNTVFKPNPDIEREKKICLIGGYGINFYIYRNKAGKKLEPTNLIKIYKGRLLNEKYPQCLQSYLSHISGSSTRYITASKMFEIMSSGSVLFTDEGNEYGLDDLFPQGSYVTYKRDGSDVIEKAKKIIYDEDFRNSIVNKGLETIAKKHSHVIRAQELIDIIVKTFNISYNKPKTDLNLIDKIRNFFIKHEKNEPVNIESTPLNIENNIVKETPKIEISEEESENIIKKLIKKGIKICILKDTCYNIIINNKIGKSLYLAVDKIGLAKKIIGTEFDFESFPQKTKQFEFKNMILEVPCPLVKYLKDNYELKAEIELSKKPLELKLIGDTYQFIQRRRRRKRK